MEKANLRITLVIWLVLGSICMVVMLAVAAHKTVVIADTPKEQGELTASLEKNTINTKSMSLLLNSDASDGKLRIPLEKGIKAENVVMENHYTEKELWIYIRGGEMDFYEENAIHGDIRKVGVSLLEERSDGLVIKLQMAEVLEYRSVLESDTLTIAYTSPKEIYKQIVVIDPVCGGEERGAVYSGCVEKDIVLQVARLLPAQLNSEDIKLYFTRTEDVSVSDEERKALVKAVDADMYISIGVSADEGNLNKYGIFGVYNEEYYIPEFGSVELADELTRQVTITSGNKALGLRTALQDDILKELQIPAARINLGYLSNEKERTLIQRDSYQEKLAKGIGEAIMEVYKKYYEE